MTESREPAAGPGGNLKTSVMATVALIVVLGVALAFLHQPSPVDDVPAAPADVAAPPGTAVTEAPPVPEWYDVDGPANGPAGTVIRTQPVTGGPDNIDVYRIIYNSSDNEGQPVPVSGLVVIPKGTPPEGGWPVVGYAHGTTGANPRCAISTTPFEPSTPGYSNFFRQISPIAEAGYVVAATDYLGLGTGGTQSYLVGKVEGQNVLDSVRAVHNWRDDVNTDLNLIWGHSQGGHSAAFAAELAPSYAPEVPFQGAAVLAPGLLPALPFAVDAIVNSDMTGLNGFVMLIIRSWTETYSDQLAPEDVLTSAGLEKLPTVNEYCGNTQADAVNQQPLGAYVKLPIPATFYDLMTVNTPGTDRIDMPIAMVQGMKDTTIIPQLTLGLQKMLCANGTQVDFRIYPNDDHPGVVVNSREFLTDWMRDRINGDPVPNNCPNA